MRNREFTLAASNHDILKCMLLIKNMEDINAPVIHGRRTPLMVALRFGIAPVVEDLLLRGADITHQCDDDHTVLDYAQTVADKDCIRLLVQYGVDINERSNEHGFTFLYNSVRKRKPDTVSLLLSLGADPNTPNENGETALHLSIRKLDVELTQYLLDFGADVNLPNRLHVTPTHMAFRAGDENILSMVLEKSPYMDIRDIEGKTPKDIARENGLERFLP